jgi:hypothetical protein
MSYPDYRNLIDRGRKAGLGTADLYRAISAHGPQAHGGNNGPADGNGFVPGYDQHGHRVYYPIGTYRRP